MAKKSAGAGPKDETPVVRRESTFLSNMLDATRRKFNKADEGETYMGPDIEMFITGVPIPALSFMYLIDSNVFPVSKCVGIAGYPESNKSALGFEVMRWFIQHGWPDAGFGKLIENEGAKLSPSLLRSIVGYDKVDTHVQVTQSQTIDVAQRHLTFSLDYLKKNSSRDVAMAMVLDSLTGSDTEESGDKIRETGFADRSFPTGALSWTQYIRWISGQLVGWPASFIFINHLKDKPAKERGGYAPPEKGVAGGTAQSFHAAFYLWMKLIGEDKRLTRVVEGKTVKCPQRVRNIQIECHKTSIGESRRGITVGFCWYFEDGKQHSYWDWEGATARLIAALQDDEVRDIKGLKNCFHKSVLADILDVKVTEKLYSSKRLGLQHVTPSEFGAAVHADAKLMDELMKFYCINIHPVWRPGVQLPAPAAPADAVVPEDAGSGVRLAGDGPDI